MILAEARLRHADLFLRRHLPQGNHVPIRISHHRHDPPRLLGRLVEELHPSGVQIPAEVQQPIHLEGEPGVPADQRLGIGVDRRVDRQSHLPLQELGAEAPLVPEWQAERIAIEFDRALQVVHEHGGGIQGDFHGHNIYGRRATGDGRQGEPHGVLRFLTRSPSPVALALSLLLAGSPATAQAPRTPWDSLARDLLRELISINTSQSAGSTVIAAEAMAKRARAAGFPDSDVVVVPIAPTKGNLIVRLRGRPSGKKPILLLSHIDVVEAKAEDWTLPPFEFIEKDGIFYGRGVADDKDEGAIHLALIFRLKAEKFVPDRDIIVALTADEEGGPNNGVEWLLANRRGLLDAEYAFNEGGGGRVKDGARVSHDVQASEKKVQNWTLEATNPGRPQLGPGQGQRDHAPVRCAGQARRVRFPGPPERSDPGLLHPARDGRRRGELGAAMRAIVARTRRTPPRPGPSRPIRATTRSSAPPAWPPCWRAATPGTHCPSGPAPT